MTRLEAIRAFFKNDRYATALTGAVIEAADKQYAKCSLTLRPEHRNAMGGVMGGVYFTLADFAFAVASNVEQPPTVSVSGTITYLGVPKGERLIAEARCLHAGRSGCAFTIDISDEMGNAVATVTFYGFRKTGEPLTFEQ